MGKCELNEATAIFMKENSTRNETIRQSSLRNIVWHELWLCFGLWTSMFTVKYVSSSSVYPPARLPPTNDVARFHSTDLVKAAVGERIVQWIRTPQIPGSRPGWYGTFYRSSDWLPLKQHLRVQRSLVFVEGRGRISRSGLTQDIIKVPSGTVVVTLQFLTNNLFNFFY